jgi:hypothetical protein
MPIQPSRRIAKQNTGVPVLMTIPFT